MDDLRGFGRDPFDGDDDGYVSYEDDDDAAIEAPPMFGGDERRMQVRAYNFWTSMLGNGNYPCIEDLEPENVDDFRENSVLLDFTSGMENPSIQYLGTEIAKECEIDESITYLDQVPPRSLLTRITDHYLQIIANRAPIGFEAEFVNQRGATIMYRGILLPFSSDDDTIDFIYGVINWKEAASDEISGELQLQVEDALRAAAPRHDPVPLWADAPSAGVPEADEAMADLVLPTTTGAAPMIVEQDTQIAVADPDEHAVLADWLAVARASAEAASAADMRSRAALYAAIGRAYDFALVAEGEPQDYAELLEDMGLTMQARAPMTPVVKLVFGLDYDKTRLTEYAAALGYAMRNGLGRGELAGCLEDFDGGLKGLVKAERQARKAAIGQDAAPATSAADPRERLRRAVPKSLGDFAGPGDEFVVLVARREADGSIALLGSVDGGDRLTEQALRKTVI